MNVFTRSLIVVLALTACVLILSKFISNALMISLICVLIYFGFLRRFLYGKKR